MALTRAAVGVATTVSYICVNALPTVLTKYVLGEDR